MRVLVCLSLCICLWGETPAKSVPRMPDGKPDFRGYWSNAAYTPLERAAALGAKEFYTEAEARDVEQKARIQDNSQAKDDIHYDNRTWQDEKTLKGLPNRRTSIVFDPADGKLPPLSEKGRAHEVELNKLAKRRAAAESADSMSLGERCISWGTEGPPMLGATYNANLQIFQDGSSVAILNEMIHNVRVIPLDGRPHLGASIHQFGGDSRGHWEGDTLVVDTTNFTDMTSFRGSPATARQNIFSSEEMHVVERFTRLDADTIAYRFTVEDPGTWTKPWSGEVYIKKFEGPIYEYACHEGNYGLTNILAGARAIEKQAAEAVSAKPAR